jgi:hypothetical protein
MLPAIIVAGLCLTAPKSHINRTNFERIQNGMTVDEVVAILGQEPSQTGACGESAQWSDGPNWIYVAVERGKVSNKGIHIATALDTVKWYVTPRQVK